MAVLRLLCRSCGRRRPTFGVSIGHSRGRAVLALVGRSYVANWLCMGTIILTNNSVIGK